MTQAHDALLWEYATIHIAAKAAERLHSYIQLHRLPARVLPVVRS